MDGITVVALGSFLLAFKAVLLEGSEVAILSLATIKQVGKKNVVLGILLGVLASLLIFLAIRQVFLFLPELIVYIVTAGILLYFSRKFLLGFVRYYFGHKSFESKMENEERELIEKVIEIKETRNVSLLNSIPVFSITLTEGFEASIVLAAAGSFDFMWTVIGAIVSILLISVVSAISYKYLMRFPRWLLDLIAGCVLLVFGMYFLVSGILSI